MVNTQLPHEASDYKRMLICLSVMAISFSHSHLMSLINFESSDSSSLLDHFLSGDTELSHSVVFRIVNNSFTNADIQCLP